MAFLRFTKLPGHQKFKYNPRFYDPRKEKLDALLRESDDPADDYELMKSRISRKLKRKATNRGMLRSEVRSSNLRLFIIIVLLFGVTYLLLAVYLPELLKLIEG